MALSLLLFSCMAMVLAVAGGPCESLCPTETLDIKQALGEWHVLMGYSTADVVPAFCKTLDIALEQNEGSKDGVRMSWTASGKSVPITNTSLRILQPGYWQEDEPGTAVVKVLQLLPAEMTLAFCELNSDQLVAASYKVLVLIRQPQISWEKMFEMRERLATETAVAETNSGYICTAALDFSSTQLFKTV